ncbi:uncharacterized protein GJ701_013163 isoform 2-T5 [Geothlypis trichas]
MPIYCTWQPRWSRGTSGVELGNTTEGFDNLSSDAQLEAELLLWRNSGSSGVRHQRLGDFKAPPELAAGKYPFLTSEIRDGRTTKEGGP